MFKIETISKSEVGRKYIFSIGRYLLITDIDRMSKNNTMKILKELQRMKIIKKSDDDISKNIDVYHEEIKRISSISENISLEYKKIINSDGGDMFHRVSINTNNFGGTYDMNEVRILNIK